MGFGTHLYLLMWKNGTLYRRQKVRLLAEIIWPLLLFLILMWVRTRGLKTYMHECHFEEKAMPSAGFVPFFQSTICSFNNTCHPHVADGTSRVTVNSSATSGISKSLIELQLLLDKYVTPEILEKTKAISEDLETLSILIEQSTDPDSTVTGSLSLQKIIMDSRIIRELLTSPNYMFSEEMVDALLDSQINWEEVPQLFSRGNVSFLAYLCQMGQLNHLLAIANPRIAAEVNYRLCSLTEKHYHWLFLEVLQQVNVTALVKELSKVTKDNVGKDLHITDWQDTINLVRSFLKEVEQIQGFQTTKNLLGNKLAIIRDVIKNPLENNTSRFIQAIICGRNISALYDRDKRGSQQHLEEYEEQITQHFMEQKEDDETTYVYDNTTTAKCNGLFHSLERNQITRLIWRQVKPFIRGKILFSPNSTAVSNMLMKVNNTFQPVVVAYNLSVLWLDDLGPNVAHYLENRSHVLKFLKNITSPGRIPLLKDAIFGSVKMSDKESSHDWNRIFESIHHILVAAIDEREHWLNWSYSFMTEVRDYLECFELNKFEGYDHEYQLINRGMELMAENKLWAGLVFTNIDPKDTVLPPFIQYKIRMDATKVDSTKKIEDRIYSPGPRRRPAIDLKYITFGFAYLQDVIEHAIIREHTQQERDTGIFLQQFPYPCYIFDQFIMAISRTFPMFMVLSWVYSSAMIIKTIVHEKECRLKEVMKVMGLGNGVLWLSWFISSIICMAISSVFLTIILVYGKIVEHSDPTLIYTFLMVFNVTSIMLSFFMSTLFSKANIAAAAGGLLFFITYLPFPLLVVWENRLGLPKRIISCLLPNVAFGFGCDYIAHLEEEGVGAQWYNFMSSTFTNDSFSFAHCMGMLLIDAVFYGILMWYIETVFPGQYGIPKKWYFFVTRSYWCGTVKDDDAVDEVDSLDHSGKQNAVCFEEEPKDLPLGIQLHRLTKVYKDGHKLAVDNLSLNFYEGQITSFLGHNGAGKTTTISMLTGMFPPSKGTATIYGADIRKDMDTIRKSLGTCPQHNVLFDELTVMEHLWFYARLKGASEKEATVEANQMIEDLGLIHKQNEISRNLSGGMQRKLSIAVAFVGGSRTVILDEPTAGVDPYSRRSIWELLLKYKSGRTIILTTHHMDEADLLGDRIAVIGQGRLRCCGSSLFLKKHFGRGYYLTMVKKGYSIPSRQSSESQKSSHSKENKGLNEVDDEGVADMSIIDSEQSDGSNSAAESSSFSPTSSSFCRAEKVTTFIQGFVPGATLIEDIGSELSYLLPTSAQTDGTLQNLLQALDKSLESIQISSYGISDTPLEEVFLRVTGVVEEEKKLKCENGVGAMGEGLRPDSQDQAEGTISLQVHRALQALRLSNLVSWKDNRNHEGERREDEEIALRQWLTAESGDGVKLDGATSPAFSWKRIVGLNLIRRQFIALLIRRFHHTRRNTKGLLAEIVLPGFFVFFATILSIFTPSVIEEPPLELSPWLYGPPNYVFFSNDDPTNPVTQKYVNSLLSETGLGTRCVERNDMKPWDCVPVDVNISYLEPQYDIAKANQVPKCSCSVGTMQCPAGASGPKPPEVTISTTDIIVNMTGRNISDWVVKTEKEFLKQRYGGFSFGIKNPLVGINFTSVSIIMSHVMKLFGTWMDETKAIEVTNKWKEEVQLSNDFDNIKVWFHNKGWASSIAYMNAVNNIILRAHLPQDKDPKLYGISILNHPMNFTNEQLQDELLKKSGLSLQHALCIIFAMSFVPASFVMFLIEDRASGSKHLQYVSGVKPPVYWIASYIWDLGSYLIPSLMCVGIFWVFNEEAYISENNIGGFFTIVFFFGFASIPLMYPASYLFTVPSSAFVVLACINLFIGVVSTISTFVLELFDDEELQFIAEVLRQVFLIFPHYCLGRGLMDLSTNHMASEMLSRYGFKMHRNPFEWHFLGRNLFSLTVQGVLYFTVILLIESQLFIKRREPKPVYVEADVEDEDVLQEKKRILSGEVTDAVVRVENLTKVYRSGQLPAVNQLSFAVQPGECFGLLGVNGAGKTTTFKMLTGDISITSGTAFVNGYCIKTELDSAQKSIGYCPQFDALDPLLTGKEHLEFYARLKGIPEKYIRKEAEWGIRKLGLEEYTNAYSGNYSGGNKRRLSTAIAILGKPSIVFLDEPTTGMDPKARRFLWNCIIDIVKSGCSVILTSHSMEECEALCTRLAIMVNGQFRCLGSIQHLKNKFGEGYTLTLRVKDGPNSLQDMAAYVERHFEDRAVLKEQRLNQMEYQLSSIPLAEVFRIMENARSELNIEDYSVSQTTLDQVFIRFAQLQKEHVEENDWQANIWPFPRKKTKRTLMNRIPKGQQRSPSRNNSRGGDISLLVRKNGACVTANAV